MTHIFLHHNCQYGRPRSFISLVVLLGCVVPLRAQLVVKLSPQTVSEFERYATGVEAEMNQRWAGKKNFLAIEDDQQARQQVLGGDLFIKQMNGGRPAEITNGLIHDWLGAIYIPNATIQQVLDILEDFDRHKDIYPAVAKSHTVRRNGNDVVGYWRLQQGGMVPVKLDVQEEVRYGEVAPGRWKGVSYARDITEVGAGLFDRGRKYPPREGHGYMWRLYAYWSLESYNGGVLAECRTLSLSRDIPQGLAWAVAPYVQKLPRDSLRSTLKETRNAVLKQAKKG
jgi:hypothetical protein